MSLPTPVSVRRSGIEAPLGTVVHAESSAPAAGGPASPAEGQSRSPRVLLLHGLAGGGNVWDGYLEHTADADQENWTAELPWRATESPEWTAHSPAHWIRQALHQVPDGPDVIIAHSFGANALLSLLADPAGPPDDIRMPRAVVLASPFYRAHAESFDWDSISYYLNGFDAILADGLRVRSGGRLSDELRQDMAAKVRDRIGPYGWMSFFDTYLRTPQLRCDRLTVPVLIVGGERDFAAFPRDSHALGAALPHATVHILPASGHFAMVEQAPEFAALTRDFIDTVVRPPMAETDTLTREHH